MESGVTCVKNEKFALVKTVKLTLDNLWTGTRIYHAHSYQDGYSYGKVVGPLATFLNDKICNKLCQCSEYQAKIDEQKQKSTKHHYHYKKHVGPMSPERDTVVDEEIIITTRNPDSP